MAPSTAPQRHAAKVERVLRRCYPHATCSLDHRNPLELLIATILSAQCTDERVNVVTKELFRRYPTAADLALVPQARLEQAIQSTGFFRNKARSIQACCRELVERYDGTVPADMDALVALPGVGRKTANVVLGTAFGQATGVVVDTHVNRVARRLGMTSQTGAERIERELMEQLSRDTWIGFSHRVIEHGRRVCKARRPLCGTCCLSSLCPRVGVSE